MAQAPKKFFQFRHNDQFANDQTHVTDRFELEGYEANYLDSYSAHRGDIVIISGTVDNNIYGRGDYEAGKGWPIRLRRAEIHKWDGTKRTDGQVIHHPNNKATIVPHAIQRNRYFSQLGTAFNGGIDTDWRPRGYDVLKECPGIDHLINIQDPTNPTTSVWNKKTWYMTMPGKVLNVDFDKYRNDDQDSVRPAVPGITLTLNGNLELTSQIVRTYTQRYTVAHIGATQAESWFAHFRAINSVTYNLKDMHKGTSRAHWANAAGERIYTVNQILLPGVLLACQVDDTSDIERMDNDIYREYKAGYPQAQWVMEWAIDIEMDVFAGTTRWINGKAQAIDPFNNWRDTGNGDLREIHGTIYGNPTAEDIDREDDYIFKGVNSQASTGLITEPHYLGELDPTEPNYPAYKQWRTLTPPIDQPDPDPPDPPIVDPDDEFPDDILIAYTNANDPKFKGEDFYAWDPVSEQWILSSEAEERLRKALEEHNTEVTAQALAMAEAQANLKKAEALNEALHQQIRAEYDAEQEAIGDNTLDRALRDIGRNTYWIYENLLGPPLGYGLRMLNAGQDQFATNRLMAPYWIGQAARYGGSAALDELAELDITGPTIDLGLTTAAEWLGSPQGGYATSKILVTSASTIGIGKAAGLGSKAGGLAKKGKAILGIGGPPASVGYASFEDRINAAAEQWLNDIDEMGAAGLEQLDTAAQMTQAEIDEIVDNMTAEQLELLAKIAEELNQAIAEELGGILGKETFFGKKRLRRIYHARSIQGKAGKCLCRCAEQEEASGEENAGGTDTGEHGNTDNG